MTQFALIEQLNSITDAVDTLTTQLSENLQLLADGEYVVETADGVLGQLAAKLKFGKLSTDEIRDYTELYSGLSMLASEDIRHAFNIDLSTNIGKMRFLNILQHTGSDPRVTKQVKGVGVRNSPAKHQAVQRDLTNFTKLSPMKQQQYVTDINKLRMAYERLKNKLATANKSSPANRAPAARTAQPSQATQPRWSNAVPA